MEKEIAKRHWFHRTFMVLALLVLAVSTAAWAAGRKMPNLKVTGGRKVGYKFKSSYEEMVKSLHLDYDVKGFRTVSWEEATKWFDSSKTLPQPTANEFSYTTGIFQKRQVNTKRMLTVFEKLYNKSFTDPQYGLKNPPAADEQWLQSFGDIMARFKDYRGKAAETDAALETLRTKHPAIWKEVGEVLPDMVRGDFLYSTKWDPYLDESAPGKANDAVLFFPYWKMQPNPQRSEYWNKNADDHHVYQAGLVIYGTLEEVKVTERRFSEYMDYVGMGNLEVAMIANSYIRGVDPKGDEFMGMEVFNSGQLPWPYNLSSFVMKMFDRYNDKGIFVCDYYSENRNDLNWMGGRDTYFDLRDSKGNYVGQLINTELDFDIKNLPEGDKDRIVTIRGNWGNIKLIVEGYKGLSKVSTGPGAWKK